MDGKVLITSPFDCRHILGILRITFERLGVAIPFDQPLQSNVTSMKGFDGSFAATEHRVWGLCYIEVDFDRERDAVVTRISQDGVAAVTPTTGDVQSTGGPVSPTSMRVLQSRRPGS